MVTITDAKVTPDLREATLYYTVYGGDEGAQEQRRGAGVAPRACSARRSGSRPGCATRRR